ncbi:MAG: hypothetical protein QOD07_2014, partial [Frankiaceae bacterium]|nr:hypothetical protein [Frankiaceae bacterium]
MFRRVAVGLVASAATLLGGAPALAGACAPPAGSPHPAATTARASHPLPAHRHRDAVKRVPATAGTNTKRDGGTAAVTAPVVRRVALAASASRRTAVGSMTAHVLGTLAARA